MSIVEFVVNNSCKRVQYHAILVDELGEHCFELVEEGVQLYTIVVCLTVIVVAILIPVNMRYQFVSRAEYLYGLCYFV